MEIIVNPNYRPQQLVINDQPTFIVSDDSASYGWKYAIHVANKKIVAFPKFLTMAIGFEGGEWDLPHDCTVEEIWWMIKSDRGRKALKADCLQAIQMLKDQIEADERQYSREEKRASEAFFDYTGGLS